MAPVRASDILCRIRNNDVAPQVLWKRVPEHIEPRLIEPEWKQIVSIVRLNYIEMLWSQLQIGGVLVRSEVRFPPILLNLREGESDFAADPEACGDDMV
jgi:hypothetical protein